MTKTETEVANAGSDMSCLIYFAKPSDGLIENEGDFLVYFLVKMLEACSANFELPLGVSRAFISQLMAQMHPYNQPKRQLSPAMKTFAVQVLPSLRTELANEFVKTLGLYGDGGVSWEYF